MRAPAKDYYDRLWRDQSRRRLLHQHLKNRIFAVSRMARSLDLEPASILDLGCGLGHMAEDLASLGTVVAMDTSLSALAAGHRLHAGPRFCGGSALVRCFRRSSFDLVVTSEVIEHLEVEDRADFVQGIWELLTPGGHLILTTPDRRLSRHVTRDQPIENHLSGAELERLLAGPFETVHAGSTQRFLPVQSHRYRIVQALRLLVYEVLRLRRYLEDPLREGAPGLYMVVLARRRPLGREPGAATRPGGKPPDALATPAPPPRRGPAAAGRQPARRAPPSLVVLIEAYLPTRGGAQNNTQELCRRLVERGHRCTVLTRRYSAEHLPSERIDGVAVRRFGLSRIRPLAKLRWAVGVMAYLRRERSRYDLVLSVPIYYWPDLLPAHLNHLLTGKPYLMRTTMAGNFDAMLSWSTASATDLAKHLLFPPPLWRRVLAAAEAVVAQSELLRERGRAFGLSNCVLIPNGVDCERFSVARAGEKPVLRARLDLPRDAVTVICTARFVVDKNQIVLLRAVEKLRRRPGSPEITLLLLGIEEFNLALASEERLRQFVSDHQMEDGVRILRDVDNVEDYLRAADIFVQPTRFDEGVSNSVLEAMSCGLPVVCSDLPQLERMFPPGQGLFFAPDDVDALCEHLRGLIALPDLGASRGLALAAHVRATQSFARTLDSYETLIRRAAGDDPAGSANGRSR